MRSLAYVDRTLEACPSGKAVFGSRREAAARMKRGSRGTKGLRPYSCPDCPYWHLGHPKSKSPKGANA